MARPTDYDKKFHPILAKWLARSGLIDTEIAKELGIATSTLYLWKKEHKEFSEALKENKDIVDSQVENKLLQRAVGYEYTEKHIEDVEIKSGKVKVPATKVKTIRKHIAPDVTAQIFWLKNRQPDKWRDRREVDIPGGVTIHIDNDDAKL
jgi:transposase-like protein